MFSVFKLMSVKAVLYALLALIVCLSAYAEQWVNGADELIAPSPPDSFNHQGLLYRHKDQGRYKRQVVGPTGPKGDRGLPGSGQTGATGATGPPAKTGASGAIGPTGPTGATGIAGPRGLKGKPGNIGPSGPLGPPGGPPGPRGPMGQIGLKGEMGYKGDQGIAGPRGLPGPKATNNISGLLVLIGAISGPVAVLLFLVTLVLVSMLLVVERRRTKQAEARYSHTQQSSAAEHQANPATSKFDGTELSKLPAVTEIGNGDTLSNATNKVP